MNDKQNNSSGTTPDLDVSYDVGHSSIGWNVLQSMVQTSAPAKPTPVLPVKILGCGVVTFGADDCLASKRRDYRRQRRHARSTRQRIARMEKLLAHLKVLTPEQLAAKHKQAGGHPAPWLLAARVLASNGDSKSLLSWLDLWDVLRWYAHNRGYDGNARWANVSEEALTAAEQEERKSDTEKEKNAVKLMDDFGKQTMAETVFADLFAEYNISDPTKVTALPFLQKRFKANQFAFPRRTVEAEVLRTLQAHKCCDPKLIHLLMARKLAMEDRAFLSSIDIPLPKRFEGGLLFGQLVPRFENRIIANCPVTGDKVPGKHCIEFLEFRWAMTLANIRIGHGSEIYRDRDGKETNLRALNADERRKIDARVRRLGFLKLDPDKPGKDGLVRPGRNELRSIVLEETKCDRHNLDGLLLHPDAKEGLKLLPVKGETTAFRVASGCISSAPAGPVM
jgi:CRISPR-associated endonuclease Csn1